MAQVSAITVLNAIELYFERFKHVPEHHATPVMFQAPDAKTEEVGSGKDIDVRYTRLHNSNLIT